jgi:phosphoadenosine phosphosulfate reductase
MNQPVQKASDSPSPYTGSDDADAVLRWGLSEYSPDVALACSFSLEDLCALHLMKQVRDDVRVFALDTGRLNEETYECADRVARKLAVEIEWFFPRHDAVQALVREKGTYSFRESVENRHECCHIRKVEPLGRALKDLQAWITGQRRAQGMTRSETAVVEIDAAHGGMIKLNPLATWSDAEIWDYVRKHKLPYNRLHDVGYPSIGCAPCTRAIKEGEESRAGRWWWENPDQKECGLHCKI